MSNGSAPLSLLQTSRCESYLQQAQGSFLAQAPPVPGRSWLCTNTAAMRNAERGIGEGGRGKKGGMADMATL